MSLSPSPSLARPSLKRPGRKRIKSVLVLLRQACSHPLSFSADCVANDICPIRRACGREDGRLPADLQDPWTLPTEHLHILGRQRGAWKVNISKKKMLLAFCFNVISIKKNIRKRCEAFIKCTNGYKHNHAPKCLNIREGVRKWGE